MSSTRKLLQEIADNQDFARLIAFREAQTWKTLSDEDREMLALLFVTLGERELASGDANAQCSFETAIKIAPGNAHICFRQGIAYLQVADAASLRIASSAFEQAASLQPDRFDHWLHWGIAQLQLGHRDEDIGGIEAANQCFLRSEALVRDNSDKRRLFWSWGICWFTLAKASGEVHDYHRASDKFRAAAAAEANDATFWVDYALTLREIGYLLERPEFYVQAFEMFVRATQLQADCYEAWVEVALLGQILFQRNGDRAVFALSDRAFRVLATREPLTPPLWLGWARLCLDYGKFHRDQDMLRLALDHFEKVESVAADQWPILSGWAEAQILVGSERERLDLLTDGLVKCQRCLELAPKHARLWCLQSKGLLEMGRYFQDESYFEQAIDALKHALTLRHNDPVIWYSFAQANYALGELRRDSSFVVRAIQSYAQVVEYGGGASSQFFNDWGVACMRLGEMTNEKKHLDQAIEKFEQAIAFHGRTRDSGHITEREGIDPEWLYNYGCSLDFLGEFTNDSKCYERAIQVLSQAIILDADFSHARYNLALAFYHLGELVNDVECFHKSLELFQSVVEQDPEDETAWNDWGVALISFSQLMRDPVRIDVSRGLLEQAELKLRHAAALGSSGAYYHLACVYSLSGNPSAALHYLDRAIVADSLPALEEVMHDEWLEDLHQTGQFREWMARLGTKPRDA